MKKRIFLTIMISFCLAVLVLLLNLQLFGFNYDWYRKEFTGLDVSGSYDMTQVESQTKNIFDYLQNRSQLQTDYYTRREIRHLADIKSLIWLAYISSLAVAITFIAALVFLFLNYPLAEAIKIIMQAGIVSALIIILLTFLLIFNFNQIFYLFHRLAFNNDYWILDPSIESLIVIFPPKLFADLALTIVSFYLAQLFLLIVLFAALIKFKLIRSRTTVADA